MATWSATPGPLQITYSWVDIKGARGTSVVHVPTATTLADADTFAQGLGDLFEAISDAKVLSYSVARSVAAEVSADAQPNGDVEEKLTTIWRTAVGKNPVVTVPAPKTNDPAAATPVDLLTVNNYDLNTTSALWAPIETGILGGIGGVIPTDSNNVDITSFVRGYVRSRRTGQVR
jgi:hypothetical protein